MTFARERPAELLSRSTSASKCSSNRTAVIVDIQFVYHTCSGLQRGGAIQGAGETLGRSFGSPTRRMTWRQRVLLSCSPPLKEMPMRTSSIVSLVLRLGMSKTAQLVLLFVPGLVSACNASQRQTDPAAVPRPPLVDSASVSAGREEPIAPIVRPNPCDSSPPPGYNPGWCKQCPGKCADMKAPRDH